MEYFLKGGRYCLRIMSKDILGFLVDFRTLDLKRDGGQNKSDGADAKLLTQTRLSQRVVFGGS